MTVNGHRPRSLWGRQQPRPEYRRPSPCMRHDGLPKFAWASRERAAEHAAVLNAERPRIIGVSPYECPQCSKWHVGERRPSTTALLGQQDRHLALLAELGPRALALLQEENRYSPEKRYRSVVVRASAALKRSEARG